MFSRNHCVQEQTTNLREEGKKDVEDLLLEFCHPPLAELVQEGQRFAAAVRGVVGLKYNYFYTFRSKVFPHLEDEVDIHQPGEHLQPRLEQVRLVVNLRSANERAALPPPDQLWTNHAPADRAPASGAGTGAPAWLRLGGGACSSLATVSVSVL